MKTIFCLLLSVVAFGQSVSVMTYNIRYDNPDDGENRWELRREHLTDQILFYNPDFIGTQEGKKHQLEYIDLKLTSHSFIGKGRDDSADGGEYSAVFYNHSKFEPIDQGTFWLSETPEKPSKSWDSSLNRICTWGLFRDKNTNKQLYVFNTHFDHIGESARLNSAKLILRKIAEINKEKLPVILTGDFNCNPESAPYLEIVKTMPDSRTKDVKSFGPSGTFNGFKFHEPVTNLIDFIFVTKDIAVKRHATLSDSRDCKYPSDHLPVFAEISLK